MKTILLFCAAAIAVAADCRADELLQPKNSDGKVFVHPGIFYTQGDFDRMKAMVAAGKQPWLRTFEALRASRWSNPNALARPRGGEIPEGRFNQTIGFDGRQAHDIALMWRLTGDEAYARKARDFLVQNSNYTATSWNGTGPLDNGKIYLLVEAAEMMRDYPGWAAEDRKKFGDMLRKVFVPHLYGGDVMRWGNQGLTAWHGLLAIAIFLDDAKMYDRVWNNLTGLPHRPDDAPYCSGGVWKPEWPANFGEFFVERTKAPAFGNEPDWGYDDQLRFYIYRNGQCEESCRDQPHCMYGLCQMVAIAETFWNQGDDLYGALDDRLLLGLEWSLRYNMSDWEPSGFETDESKVSFENGLFYQARTRNNRWSALKPSTHGRGSEGGSGAPKTAALMHYAVRKGLPNERMQWLYRSVKKQHANNGFEDWGVGPNWFYEWEGWGTLTKTRTKWQSGDPGTWRNGARVSRAHALPGVIRAVDYDFLANHGGQNRRTASYPGGGVKPSQYRPDASVPIERVEGGWCLASLKKGEWCRYTAAVAETGVYAVSICCRNLGSLEVSISADGGDPVAAVLPRTAEPEFMPVGKLKLEAGAPVLRLEVERASASQIFGLKFERVK